MRLQRKGRSKAPFYHIVVADGRSPRDGRFIEKIGTYNPLTVPATIELNRDAAFKWIMNGAQPTDTVRAILRYKGVFFQKHLHVGVLKGAITAEAAALKLSEWLDAKQEAIDKNKAQVAEKQRKFVAAVDGTPRVKAKAEPEPEPEAEAPVEDAVEASPSDEAPVAE
jgi:small subunit ribosomal protein S16